MSLDKDRQIEELKLQVEELENVLRSIASYVASGGYNTTIVNPISFEKKIKLGIDNLVDCAAEFAKKQALARDS